MHLSEAVISEEFKAICWRSLRVDTEKITPEAHLMKDLGAESLDLIEITMEVESAFNVCIPDKSILDTATEIFGPDVLAVDGRLTDAGKQLLRQRLGESEAFALEGEVLLKDLRSSLMTVRAWIRMIHHLAQHTPTVCDSCGVDLKPDLGSRMICPECKRTFAIPAGEEINRIWVKEYYRTVHLSSTGSAADAAGQAAAACT